MHLTGQQLRTLRYYLKHKDHNPTWGEFLTEFGLTLILWTVIGAVGGILTEQIGMPLIGVFMVGMLLGAAIREAHQHDNLSRSWPALSMIVDWDRAQALLEESERLP